MATLYHVRKSSLEDETKSLRYVGIRDISDTEKIKEEDIVDKDGIVIGVKNRVRAGLQHFTGHVRERLKEEGQVVVYTTSFQAVRGRYELCKRVVQILKNHRVKVDERDIFISPEHLAELKERINDKISVPQVFINGQHIGGFDELDELNETGKLRELLRRIPKTSSTSNCETCGGYIMVPCPKCKGSKNSCRNNFTTEFKALRCTKCNRNGLVPCPTCSPTSPAPLT